MTASPNVVLAALAGKCGLSTTCRMIKIKAFVFGRVSGRGRCIDIRIAIRRAKSLSHSLVAVEDNAPIAPHLDQRLADVARVKHEAALNRHAGSPIAAELQTKGST